MRTEFLFENVQWSEQTLFTSCSYRLTLKHFAESRKFLLGVPGLSEGVELMRVQKAGVRLHEHRFYSYWGRYG